MRDLLIVWIYIDTLFPLYTLILSEQSLQSSNYQCLMSLEEFVPRGKTIRSFNCLNNKILSQVCIRFEKRGGTRAHKEQFKNQISMKITQSHLHPPTMCELKNLKYFCLSENHGFFDFSKLKQVSYKLSLISFGHYMLNNHIFKFKILNSLT